MNKEKLSVENGVIQDIEMFKVKCWMLFGYMALTMSVLHSMGDVLKKVLKKHIYARRAGRKK
ncbi:MAG: hypothetical protein KAI53_05335 [Candidatus Aenigmarchaeota archaeon]|nr:hypothetical protein [Candidatus Aenigmarchaeota archaeon]